MSLLTFARGLVSFYAEVGCAIADALRKPQDVYGYETSWTDGTD